MKILKKSKSFPNKGIKGCGIRGQLVLGFTAFSFMILIIVWIFQVLLLDKFYEFNPGFLGNGIGFLTYQLNTFMNVDVASVHNDFLQYFIDLGFWGYILWLASMTILRVCYFGKNGNIENAILAFSLTLYLVIVSSTDNTMNYPLLTGVLAMLMMGNSFSENVCRTENKMFNYISAVNREERDSLL